MQSYSDLLKDPRWRAKREEVLKLYDGQCSNCASTRRLMVHHPFYEFGRQPWEYDASELQALCRECHLRAELDRSELIRTLVRVLSFTTTARVVGYLKGLEADYFGGHFGFEVGDHEEAVGFGDVVHAAAEEVIEVCGKPREEKEVAFKGWDTRRTERERVLRSGRRGARKNSPLSGPIDDRPSPTA